MNNALDHRFRPKEHLDGLGGLQRGAGIPELRPEGIDGGGGRVEVLEARDAVVAEPTGQVCG